MKFRVFVASVILILLMVLIGTGMGCNSGGGSMDLAKDIPEDARRFNLVDIETLRADDNLEDLYYSVKDDYKDWLEEYGIDFIGFNDIDSIAICGDYTLLYGNFNLDNIRDELNDLNYDDDEYMDVEIWERMWESDDRYEWFALIGKDLIIFGSEESVKDCIKVIEQGEGSLWDDSDYKDVTDRLPTGIIMRYSTHENYPDQEAQGTSIQKKDADTLNIKVILKFNDEDAAEDAIAEATEDIIDDIEHDIKEGYIKTFNVDQDREFIIVTAEIDIDDFRVR